MAPIPGKPVAGPVKSPVEKKVTWSAVLAYLGGLAVMAVLNAVATDDGLISALPAWAESLVVPIVPAVISFVGGWFAKHTPRPDLPASGASATGRRVP